MTDYNYITYIIVQDYCLDILYWSKYDFYIYNITIVTVKTILADEIHSEDIIQPIQGFQFACTLNWNEMWNFNKIAKMKIV